MSEEKVLTEEIVEEIINNLKPEEKTLDFSEFTSSEVSLEFIKERVFESFRFPEVYNFNGLKEIPDDFALKIAKDFAENDGTTYTFKGLSELNKTFEDNVIRIPYGKIIFPEKFEEVERSLFTLDSSKVKKILELEHCHGESRWRGFKYITAAAACLVAKEGGAIIRDLVEITPEVATALAGCLSSISLPSLKSIDVESAKELSNFSPKNKFSNLSLDGLEYLDDKVAAELAKIRSKGIRITLSFNGIKSLNENLAKSLSKFKGDQNNGGCLSLDGLKSLDQASAAQLSKIQHASIVLGLNLLDPATAKILSEYKPNKAGSRQNLVLNNLTEISNEALEQLKVFKGETISLGKICKVDLETAKTLTFFKDAKQVHALGEKQEGGSAKVNISQVTNEMSPETVGILSSHFSDLELNFDKLSKEMASVLASNYKTKYNSMNFSNNLKSCSAEALRELISYKGEIKLPGIVELDDECAEVLSKSKGVILDGLKEISKDGALNLLKGGVKTSDYNCNLKEIGLGCIEDLTEITPEIAELLAQGGGKISLPSLTEISEDVAKLFADSESEFREVNLDGLTSISPVIASLLSKMKITGYNTGLHLNGLTSLNVDFAKAFNSAPFELYLNGIEEIDHDSAVELVKNIKDENGRRADWAQKKKYYFGGLNSKKINSDTAELLQQFTDDNSYFAQVITNIDLEPIAEGFSD